MNNSENNGNEFDISDYCDEAVLRDLEQDIFFGSTQLRTDNNYRGFDNNSGDSWIYPTNYPIRQYQYNITQQCLFKNTLVVLPTGLGKTFIAAVCMYNFYRWYPKGKVIFMAPTRPLVAQQIEACYDIVGIPKSDSIEITGKLAKVKRKELWQSKRVFFCTPQSVESDLFSDDDFPIEDIKMVCIDEAHKAKGKFAYVQVLRSIYAKNKNFRVLALSATPGRSLQDVGEVIHNLLISHVEIRYENSIDVAQYTHRKNIKTVVIPFGPEVTSIRNKFIQIIEPHYIKKLQDYGVVSGTMQSLSKNSLIMYQNDFKQGSFTGRPQNYSDIVATFSVSISLFHALEILERSGIQLFLNFFDDPNNCTEQKYFVSKDFRLKAFIDELKEKYSGVSPLNNLNTTLPSGKSATPAVDFEYGHPKYDILKNTLLEYFQENENTRVIVFCELRESTVMIHSKLSQHKPLLRPRILVGQGSSSGIRAVSQKEQIAVIKDFKSGKNNILIATCVGEEGIDIGEVNLIVCMDISSRNPTRFVQRIGRTGRKRQGKIIMLVSEGKEHAILKDVLASKDKTNQKISRSSEILKCMYRSCPRMVPPEFNPKCLQTFIKLPEENVEEENTTSTRKKKTTSATTTSKRKRRKSSEDEEEAGPSNATDKPSAKNKKSKKGPDIGELFKKIQKQREEAENVVPAPEIVETPCEMEVIDTPVISVLSTSPIPISLEAIYTKKIRDLRNFVCDSDGIQNTAEILMEEKYPIFLRKMILENESTDYIDDLLESKQFLTLLESYYDMNLDDIGELKKLLNKLETIFGDEKLKEESTKFSNLTEELDGTVDDAFVSKIKSKLPKCVQKQEEKSLEIEDEISRANESDFNSDLDNIPSFIENESNYHDQINKKFPIFSPIINSRNLIFNNSFNTPKEKPIPKPKSKLTVQESPLLRAFENSIKKKLHSSSSTPKKPMEMLPSVVEEESKHKTKECDITEALKYFGLNSIDDIFADAESPEDVITTKKDSSSESSEVVESSQKSQENLNYTPTNLTSSNVRQRVPLIQKLKSKLHTVNVFNERIPEKSILSPIEGCSKSIEKNQTFSDSDGEADQLLANIPLSDLEKKSEMVDDNFQIDLNQSSYTITQILQKVNTQKNKSSATIGEEMMSSQPDNGMLLRKTKQENVPEKSEMNDFWDIDKIFADSEDDSNLSDKTVIYNVDECFRQTSKASEPSTSFKSPCAKNTNHSIYQVVEILENDENRDLNRRWDFQKTVERSPSIFSKSTHNSTITQRHRSQNPSTLKRSTGSPVSAHPVTRTQSSPEIRKPPRRLLVNLTSSSNDTDGDESSQFLTAQTSITPPAQSAATSTKGKRKTKSIGKRLASKKHCAFLDAEAGVSGSENEDEEEDSDLDDFINDSLICSQDVIDDSNVDMQAKYLESVKSPIGRPGKFKIPQARKSMNFSEIFSQMPSDDEDDEDLMDSFVVKNDAELDVESQMCELEKAEMILKQRRREKKLQKLNPTVTVPKKKRRIILPEDSDSDDEMESFRKKMKMLPD